MTALVTGVAGFVGSTLARRLLDEGESVVGIDSLTDYYDPALKRANLGTLRHESFRFVEADLLDPALDVTALVSDAVAVFHLAGQPGVRNSWGEQFGVYTRSNVDVTQRLLEAAISAPRLERFVYASSSSVYGDATSYPTHETDLPAPISPYGVTKLAAEHLCGLYASQHGVPTTALRYFTVYGPRQRPDMAFTRFIRAALVGEPIAVYGDGEQIRDFTYVDDIVEANLLAARTDVAPGSVFNVAGGSSVTVNQVLQLLGSFGGRAPLVEHREAVLGDVRRTGGAAGAIERDLGWRPAVSFEAGLRRQYDWGRTVFTP